MSFRVRRAKVEDLDQLYNLAKQFVLLNLPADKSVLERKLEKTEKSFSGELPKTDSLYIFVVEDLDQERIVGSSQLVAQKGSEKNPCYSFKVTKRENFSQSLGIGFIHQVLQLEINKNGPTELGGLVVDRNYRNHPEKIGKLISLSRFLFLKMHSDKFQKDIHAEMAPPLTDDGRSPFWESLGRRFTGIPYQEADTLSYQNKEFIESLFPSEEIYLCLLDAQARLVLGQVSEETVPALKMLEKMGLKYKYEVDPFDGGPHVGAEIKDVKIIKESRELCLKPRVSESFSGMGIVASQDGVDFNCILSPYSVNEEALVIPDSKMKLLEVSKESKVIFYKMY